MKYRISVPAEVAAQILSVSSYLDGVRDGLGLQFEKEVEITLLHLSEFPHMYKQEFGPVHRAVLSRFKQVIFYVVEGQIVTVLEIRDARRKPPDWEARGFKRT